MIAVNLGEGTNGLDYDLDIFFYDEPSARGFLAALDKAAADLRAILHEREPMLAFPDLSGVLAQYLEDLGIQFAPDDGTRVVFEGGAGNWQKAPA